MKNTEKTMDKLVALCKGRGFIYPGSEIYGGLANTWDFGPLGVELKNNIKSAWRKKFIQECKYNVSADFPIPLWIARLVRHVTERTILSRTLTAQTVQAGQTSR